MTRNRTVLNLIVVSWAFVSVTLPPPIEAQGSISLVTSRSALGANDSVDWGSLGPTGYLSLVPNPFTTQSPGGLTIRGSLPAGQGPFDILLQCATPGQGGPSCSLAGNFSPGDKILFTNFSQVGPLTLVFSAPVAAAGFQIENDATSSFTAAIQAFNGSTLLGTVTEAGMDSANADGSAIFIGVRSASANITSIVVSSYDSSGNLGALLLNELSLSTGPPCSYSLFPAGESFGAAGGVGSFSITTAPGCTWSLTFSASWLKAVVPPAPVGGGSPQGQGDGVVTYAVAANTGGPRTGSVLVGMQAHTVTQQGVPLSSGSACNGVYSAAFNGNVTVSTGQTCTLMTGNLSGNLQQNGGNLILEGVGVNGNLQIGGGTFSVSSSTIGGDLQIQNIPPGTAQNQICGTNVKGNLQFQNNGTAVQIGSTAPACIGNFISGNLEVHNNTGSTAIIGNTVRGNLQDQNNSGATQVVNNAVTQNLQCQSNLSITGGGNTAGQKQGQCAAF